MTTVRDHRARPDLFAHVVDVHEEPGPSDASTARPPKGYVRTDEHVRGEIREGLASQELDWSELEVLVSRGEVTLRGLLGDRATRLEAERVARRVSGVRNVVNETCLVDDTER